MRQFAFAVLSTALLGVVSVSAQADTLLGIYGGVDGVFVDDQSNHPQTSNNVVASYYLAFEHPVPFLPNAKLRYMKFDQTDSGVIGSTNFNAKGKAESLDAIGYFEILDNVVSLDVGAGAKRINTNVDTTTTVSVVTQDYDKTIPALYASVGGKLPFTGLSAKAEVFVGKGNDADFSDVNAEIKYNFIENVAIDLGLKAGYRAMMININDSKSNGDIELRGPYLGLEAHF